MVTAPEEQDELDRLAAVEARGDVPRPPLGTRAMLLSAVWVYAARRLPTWAVVAFVCLTIAVFTVAALMLYR